MKKSHAPELRARLVGFISRRKVRYVGDLCSFSEGGALFALGLIHANKDNGGKSARCPRPIWESFL